jgi:pyruvate carboxylase
MEKDLHLFVYGTLRKQMGHPLSHLLVRHGKFLGLGIFQGKLYDLGRYPGVMPSSNKTDLVTGEVYHLHEPDRVLHVLDEYEGPRFKRTLVSVFFEPESHLSCWAYLYTRSVAGRRIITSGDYVQFRNAS